MRHVFLHNFAHLVLFICIPLCSSAFAVDLRGLVDVRLFSNAHETGEFSKLRHDKNRNGLVLGQAMFRIDTDISDTISGSAIFNAADDRKKVFDITEAWLRWNPIPSNAWKHNLKAGVFFPALSLENDGLGWTTTRTISSSALNSWIGEEFRTRGLEYNLVRRGRASGDRYDVGVNVSLFNGNDASGGLVTWRGWRISDRISGLSESLQLPDLAVYRASGEIPLQTRQSHPFREIDGRLGYQVGALYSYGNQFKLSAMHYDNRAEPLTVKAGQYSWRTRLQHLSAKLQVNDWEYLAQYMQGATFMGPRAAGIDLKAWYFLISHPIIEGKLALRFDRFQNKENDILPSDPNGEHGSGFALAYTQQLSPSLQWAIEVLSVNSKRALSTPIPYTDSNTNVDLMARSNERSISTSIRWHF